MTTVGDHRKSGSSAPPPFSTFTLLRSPSLASRSPGSRLRRVPRVEGASHERSLSENQKAPLRPEPPDESNLDNLRHLTEPLSLRTFRVSFCNYSSSPSFPPSSPSLMVAGEVGGTGLLGYPAGVTAIFRGRYSTPSPCLVCSRQERHPEMSTTIKVCFRSSDLRRPF